MTIERVLRGTAGFLVFASALLGYYHSAYWLLFTGFVGLNLLQSSFTNWCPTIAILKAFGIKREKQTKRPAAGA